MRQLEATLWNIYRRKEYLDAPAFVGLLETVLEISEIQDREVRPLDRRGMPGGIVYIDRDRETDSQAVIVVPDLHARMEFILAIMDHELEPGLRVIEALEQDLCTIVCVGDGFHGEARVRDRWYKAFDEYAGDFHKHKAMDEEMRESLGLLEMILELRKAFPANFFFLKGNHENIANEGIEGNYPFGKFVREGEMVTYWVRKFLGDEVFKGIYLYEKSLPILAVCRDFIVTHAEPARYYDPQAIINCYLDPEIIYAFTWTDNDAAEEDSVTMILDTFFPDDDQSVMFGGHRPIRDRYNLRAGGRYIQLHNPDDFIIAIVRDIHAFDISKDIHCIEFKE